MRNLKRVLIQLLIGSIITICDLHAVVFINEVMPCNLSTAINEDNYNFSGYLEFKNTDTLDVDLKSYVLTHYKLKKGGKYELKWSWTFDSKFKVPASSFNILWLDEEAISNHAPYKLDADGGYVTLYKGSQLVDSISYGSMDAHVSYGRYGSSFGYMEPTPLDTNSFSVPNISNRCAKPKFGNLPGVNQDSVEVILSSTTANASIYYTTDGTEPSINNGKQYTTSFFVSSNKNIRARAYKDNLLPSKILTGCYIFPDSQHEGCGGFSVPIVSITVDDAYMNDDQIGISVVGSNGISGEKDCVFSKANYNRDWKRPMNFEYIVGDKQVLSQEIEASVEGGCSRSKPVKSLTLKASKKTGNNEFNYKFFSSKPDVEYQTLHLRNGGTAYSDVRFRDGLMQAFAVGMNVDYQAYQPVAYYLNGKYKGLMGLRERTNVDYLKANYDMDEEDVDLVSLSDQTGINASKGSLDAYNALVSYLEDNTSSEDSYYDGACRLMDMDEYVDYQIIEQFMVNVDWPGNNTKLWRSKNDGRFRWILYDMDMGLGLNGYTYLSVNSMPMTKWCKGEGNTNWGNNEPWMTTIFKNLSMNDKFKKKFVTKYLFRLSSTFSKDRIETVFDSVTTLLNNEYCAYSGGESATSAAENMKTFALSRAQYVYDDLLDYTGGDSLVDLSVKANVPGAVFTMNGEQMSSYDGKYFSGYGLDLQTYAPSGYRFVRWECNPVINEENTSSVSYSLMSKNNVWRYFYTSEAPAGDWSAMDYDDSSWESGVGRFGYNTSTDNADYDVVLDFGDDSSNKYVTAYFRGSFVIDDLEDIIKLKARLTFDDGYVFYVNGKEVDKMNLGDTVTCSTLTTTYANDDVREFYIDRSFLSEGKNTIAVEMHQTVLNSSDLTFDCLLTAVAHKDSPKANESLSTMVGGSLSVLAIFEKMEEEVFPTLLINEICASSNSKSDNPDDYSNYPDWIEIYNNGTESCDLAGMYLSNDQDDLKMSQIPYGYEQTVIKPKEHKILWAKGDAIDGPLYLNFKIDADNPSYIYLSYMSGSGLKTLDYMIYNLHPTNASFGRTVDASDDWIIFKCDDNDSTSLATPSEANGSIFCPGESEIMEPIADQESLTVYPNPASLELYISSEEIIKQIFVYDHTGKLLEQKQVDANLFKMNVSDWNSGVYLLRVMTDNAVFLRKVIKL